MGEFVHSFAKTGDPGSLDFYGFLGSETQDHPGRRGPWILRFLWFPRFGGPGSLIYIYICIYIYKGGVCALLRKDWRPWILRCLWFPRFRDPRSSWATGALDP